MKPVLCVRTDLKASPVGQVTSNTVRFWPINDWDGQNNQEVGDGHEDEEHDVEVAMCCHEFLETHSSREPQDDEHSEVQAHGIDHQGRERAVHPHSCTKEP